MTTTNESSAAIGVSIEGAVATVELRRPPHNYFDIPLIRQLADAFEDIEADPRCHAIVLAAQGKSFCAGADFSNRDATPEQRSPRAVNPHEETHGRSEVSSSPSGGGGGPLPPPGGALYGEALRLFACTKPVVAAVHGAAVGGGPGLALVADFRVTCAQARFSANFNRLGIHPGFGLSVTLPRLIGVQQAALLFYTGRRIDGEQALAIGLADRLVAPDEVRAEAGKLAHEIATSAPLAVRATRATLRAGLVESLRVAVAHESVQQNAQFKTADFQEGIAAMAQRREPRFRGE